MIGTITRNNEFMDFIEQKEKKSLQISEMSEDEVILAAEKAGNFDYLKEPSNDIYALNDGESL